MSTIDLPGLNRATLARQHLLEPSAADEPAVLAHLGPLHWQHPIAPFVSLWARQRDFDPARLIALCEDRAAVKSTLVRGTLHLATRDAYPAVAVVTEQSRQALWRRNLRGTGIDQEALLGAVRAAADGAPVSADDLAARCAGWVAEHAPGAATAGLATHKWKLVRGTPHLLLEAADRGWATTQVGRYRSARSQLPALRLPAPHDALVQVVRTYLGCLGPATVEDVAFWTGERITPVRAALRELDLVELTGPRGARYLDLRDAPRPDPGVPAPARLLAPFDAMLLGYASGARDRVLPPRYAADISLVANAITRAVLLLDGYAAGTWRLTRPGGDLEITAFRPLGADRDAVLAAAEDLTAMLRAAGVPVSGAVTLGAQVG
jgi:winged helix DNA-binding protein